MTISASSPRGFKRQFDVVLHGHRIGGIHRRGSTIAFAFDDNYWEDPHRRVMGLRFEERVTSVHFASNRMPWWFENLLPEGDLARVLGVADLAADRFDRESELFTISGGDLAGAVQLIPAEIELVPGRVEMSDEASDPVERGTVDDPGLRFSIAGVGLKFSMRKSGDRFAMPSVNEQGYWLVKLPDRSFPRLPRNEFATMSLAHAVGLEVPRIALVNREQVGAMDDAWWAGEVEGYAIERFDRTKDGRAIHIEDLAQVRGVFSTQKYEGNVETVANIVYRGRDEHSLVEFTKRVAFNLIIGNSDAHLKNWSIRYADGRRPSLSPAYDLVAVIAYSDRRIDARPALRFANRRDYSVSLDAFSRMARKLGVQLDLAAIAAETAELTLRHWSVFEEVLSESPDQLKLVREHASAVALRLLGRRF